MSFLLLKLGIYELDILEFVINKFSVISVEVT